ncbi:MAG: uroporphyrinogen decarboxylase family protein [Candidatus Hodarchaeota archaeon]
MLEKAIYLFKKPWLDRILGKVAPIIQKFTNFQVRVKCNNEKFLQLYETRKRRCLDAIFLQKEPDRVPVIANGLNFFPAKYAGFSCEDYMFDFKKNRIANLKVVEEFDLDMYFIPGIFGAGRFFEFSQFDLVKLPGRHISADVCHQINEKDRLKPEEYDEFIERGIDFLIDTLSPRLVPGIFKRKGIARIVSETRLILEAFKLAKFAMDLQVEMSSLGAYTIFGSVGFPPYDIMSFTFRTLESLSKDLMKRERRQKIIEICERMNPWLISVWNKLPKITGSPGVWFPSERAFSLSPRQFEKYYWPTLKDMIVAMVKQGMIPFLTWESDVTHLVKFLLELPRKISRRCVFNCDTSDIFQVNKILDGHMAIAGNIPLSIMCVGSKSDVDKYCENLFAELKPGGGFLLSPALGIPDEAKPENVYAMIDFCHKFGKYS